MPIPTTDLAYDSENELDEEWMRQRDEMVIKLHYLKFSSHIVAWIHIEYR